MSLEVRYTGEDLARMRGHFELVRGELVAMVPPGYEHGRIAVKVAVRLEAHVSATRAGDVVVESGFYLERDPDTVRGPDVAFYSAGKAPTDPTRFATVPPDLAVEIVSPTDSSEELETRVRAFLAAGVGEVWVLYPSARTLHRYRPEFAEVLTLVDTLVNVPSLPGFSCRVRDLF